MRSVSADHQPGEQKLAWPPSLPSSCLLKGVQDSPGAAQLVVIGLFADDTLGRQTPARWGRAGGKPQEGGTISLGICCFPPTPVPAPYLEESGFSLMEQVIWARMAQQMCPSSQTCADHKIIDPVIEIPALHLGPLLSCSAGKSPQPYSPRSLPLSGEPQAGVEHKAPLCKHGTSSVGELLEVG